MKQKQAVYSEEVEALRGLLAVGERDAVTGPTLCAQLGDTLSGRTDDSRLRQLRYLVSLAHSEGLPVAGGDRGYFLATQVADFQRYAERLRKQAQGLLEKAQHVERLEPCSEAA